MSPLAVDGNGHGSSAQTIPNSLNEGQRERVTHPCHPLSGYEFDPIRLFNCLGTLRVEFVDPNGRQISLPIGCTTLAEEEPYLHFSDGNGLFRVPDLLELLDLMSLIKH